jgi:hypothetical protein
MTQEQRHQQIFAEMVLELLEDRFPWLATTEEAQVSGADTIDQLSNPHQILIQQRLDARRDKGEHDE